MLLECDWWIKLWSTKHGGDGHGGGICPYQSSLEQSGSAPRGKEWWWGLSGRTRIPLQLFSATAWTMGGSCTSQGSQTSVAPPLALPRWPNTLLECPSDPPSSLVVGDGESTEGEECANENSWDDGGGGDASDYDDR